MKARICAKFVEGSPSTRCWKKRTSRGGGGGEKKTEGSGRKGE